MTDRNGMNGNRWAARSLSRWRLAAACSAIGMLAILAWAPTKAQFVSWRRVQAGYNQAAQASGAASIPIKIRQTWLPSAGKADRCGTCHLAMAGEQPIEGNAPFRSHPPIPHEPESFGCTYCHAGQGWATVETDAHGQAGQWPHPLLPLDQADAGCGTCHSGLVAPLPETIEEAPELVEQYGCISCHGKEKQASPLDGIALRGIPSDWKARHKGLFLPSEEIEPVSNAPEDEKKVLDAWLATKTGAPGLVRGKMVFFQLGCMGCHRRGNVGGDTGPELTSVGDKDVRELAGEEADSQSLPDFLEKHLRDPQALTPTSRMPPVDMDRLERPTDLDHLVTYLLSLRGERIPAEFTPPDRAKVEYRLGRDFPTTGRGLFATFCSACHGDSGTGAEMETLGLVTPMVGTRGFQAMVTPRYIRSTMLTGRRSRYMPAWGPEDAGLDTHEVDAIVRYLASKGYKVKPYRKNGSPGEPEHGQAVYAERCLPCHTGSFGADLTAAASLRHFDRERVYDAVMRGWVEQGMPSFAFLRKKDTADLLAYLLPDDSERDRSGPNHDGEHSHLGHKVFQARCAKCHGTNGEGGEAPMLNTGPYLAWADDSYLAARITDHRGKLARETIGNLSEDDLDAVLDHLRNWSGLVDPAKVAAPPTNDAVERGRELFQPRCPKCHGNAGEGKTGPAIASGDFLDLVSRPFLAMTIIEGRKGTTMPAWSDQKEQPLTVAEAFDITDYLRSLSSKPAPQKTANLSDLKLEASKGE